MILDTYIHQRLLMMKINYVMRVSRCSSIRMKMRVLPFRVTCLFLFNYIDNF